MNGVHNVSLHKSLVALVVHVGVPVPVTRHYDPQVLKVRLVPEFPGVKAWH